MNFLSICLMAFAISQHMSMSFIVEGLPTNKIAYVLLPPDSSVQPAENLEWTNPPVIRQKRQFGFNRGFGFSSSNANANAFSQGFGPNGFGSSAANAQAQSFGSSGPLGSFGASAANSASQGFGLGPRGLSGSAAFGGSQTYNLPGGRDISLSYSQGVSIGDNGRPTYSGGQAISFN